MWDRRRVKTGYAVRKLDFAEEHLVVWIGLKYKGDVKRWCRRQP